MEYRHAAQFVFQIDHNLKCLSLEGVHGSDENVWIDQERDRDERSYHQARFRPFPERYREVY